MYFFNGTPSGRILGRFSSDVNTVRVAVSVFGDLILSNIAFYQLDDSIPQSLSISSAIPVQVLASAILIGVYLPYFLIALAGASVFFIIGTVHLRHLCFACLFRIQCLYSRRFTTAA